MTIQASAGRRLRDAHRGERPLQVVGAINAYFAMLAERVGYKSIYLSGAGVANASFGLPDLGMTSLDDVLEDVRRITGASRLPLLVDIDTGWGGAFNIARTIKAMTRAGAAARPHRRSGCAEAVRSPTEQGDRSDQRDDRSNQGRDRCEDSTLTSS